ncbi:hypothetical protein Ae201684P_006818 [Aphanomyces euteiches]|nr:hypothetical protein Ae201684P_006818 [Aphanomyces euteiches]
MLVTFQRSMDWLRCVGLHENAHLLLDDMWIRVIDAIDGRWQCKRYLKCILKETAWSCRGWTAGGGVSKPEFRKRVCSTRRLNELAAAKRRFPDDRAAQRCWRKKSKERDVSKWPASSLDNIVHHDIFPREESVVASDSGGSILMESIARACRRSKFRCRRGRHGFFLTLNAKRTRRQT